MKTSVPCFLRMSQKRVKIPGSSNSVIYEPVKKIGIITSNLGTSKAISLGAYNFALSNLKNKSSNTLNNSNNVTL